MTHRIQNLIKRAAAKQDKLKLNFDPFFQEGKEVIPQNPKVLKLPNVEPAEKQQGNKADAMVSARSTLWMICLHSQI